MSEDNTEVEVEQTETEQGQAAETDVLETANESEQGEVIPETPEERIKKLEQEAKAKQLKIDRQRKALSEADRRESELRAKAVEFEKIQSQLSDVKEPDINNYDTMDEFNAATREYIEKQTRVKLQKEFIEQEQAKQYQNKIVDMERKFQKDEAEFRQVNPNYDDAAQEFSQYVKSLNPNPQVRLAIMEVAAAEGNASQLINYFGENGGARLDEFEQIAAMSPTRAAVEVYKIQQKLNRFETPAKKEPLPKPPQRASGSGTVNKSLKKMSYEELKKAILK